MTEQPVEPTQAAPADELANTIDVILTHAEQGNWDMIERVHRFHGWNGTGASWMEDQKPAQSAASPAGLTPVAGER
jgi:hypothetical protein